MNKSKTAPLVTVVITCYNYGEYVAEAIESVWQQTYDNIELIVINDGSTDDSDAVIKKLKAKHKFTYISQENQGIIATRNKGMSLATGEYVMQLDADDLLPTNYVEKLLEVAFEQNVDIVYADSYMFGAVKEKTNFPQYSFEELKNHNYINVSSLVRSAAIGNTKFDEVLSSLTHEDWDFFLSLCVNGASAAKCSDTYLKYRIHDDSRNNKMKGDSAHRKYIDVYAYIIDKYIQTKPADFAYLAGRTFAHWYVGIDEKSKRLSSQLELAVEHSRMLQRRLDLIHDSTPYKLYKRLRIFRHPKEVAKLPVRKLRSWRQATMDSRSIAEVAKQYDMNNPEVARIQRKKETKLAVVVHLYYPDLLSPIVERLKALGDRSYDVFFTVSQLDKDLEAEIQKQAPDAYIFVTPNRGRDVLPFTWVAQQIYAKGYTQVLKLHTKKSPHRDDGDDWFEGMLEGLLPKDQLVMDRLFKVLEKKDTGVVGPKDVYYPLTINFPGNKPGLKKGLKRIYGTRKTREYIYDKRAELGFFGGTMFWARLDAIQAVFGMASVRDFETEKGQVDGTFAHALERLFCIVPEIAGKHMYEVSGSGVTKIDYKSNNIPDWSTDHYL